MQQLGPYRLQQELGRGGMGAVYRATDARSGAEVALKVLLDIDPLSLARFQREAELVRGLSHPGLIRVYELSLAPPRPYAAFELVEGETLKRRVERAGPLPWREAVGVIVEVAAALEVAHARGLLHRDVKPANVILSPGGAKLADFGVVKQLDAESLTATGALVGTPSYLAPEQALGDRARLSPATDVYGLAATLYFALTGDPPFRGPTLVATLERVIAAPAPSLRAAQRGLPAELEDACARGLAKEPQARFERAADFARALEAGRAAGPAPRRRRGGLAVAIAAGLALSGAAWVGLAPGGAPSASRVDAVTAQVIELRRLEQAGDEAAVEAALDALEQRFPGSPKPSRERGLWRRRQGKLEEAERAFTRSLEREASAEVYARRAEVRGVRGDAEGADRDLARALELEPEHGPAWFLRGRGLILRGEAGAAREAFERALASGHAEEAAYAGWVAALQELREEAALSRALEEGLKRYPTSGPLLIARARSRREGGDRAGALDDLRAAARESVSGALLVERAWVRLEQGDPAAAQADVTRATEVEPRLISAWELRARLAESVSDFDEATSCRQQIVEFAATDPVAWEELARVQLLRGDDAQSEASASRALALAPRSPFAYELRAAARLRLDRPQEAAGDYGRAIELRDDPGYDLFVGLANALAASLDLGPAVEALDRALDLAPAPAQAELYGARARLQVARWRLESSVADATRALEREPRRASVLATRAEAYYKLGRLEEALADSRAASDLDPQLPFVSSGEVLALLDLGRLEEALARAEAELARKPSSTLDCLRAEVLWRLGRHDLARRALAPRLPPRWVSGLALSVRAGWRLEEGAWALGVADCSLGLADPALPPLYRRPLLELWLRHGFGLARGRP